ncbi:hypothetical protein Pcinc_031775 [Petrolisthes cinctipes]|uniref:Uncharacterized protein n=1 Tax=Petrolisthes cinctipes TaxID=88211 RepID=A0AAE1EVY6_PETCI|nr:hypothetical protein Pcinc_031775 [Petrolisthes cinctipes]
MSLSPPPTPPNLASLHAAAPPTFSSLSHLLLSFCTDLLYSLSAPNSSHSLPPSFSFFHAVPSPLLALHPVTPHYPLPLLPLILTSQASSSSPSLLTVFLLLLLLLLTFRSSSWSVVGP